jgi:hypothetical protein
MSLLAELGVRGARILQICRAYGAGAVRGRNPNPNTEVRKKPEQPSRRRGTEFRRSNGTACHCGRSNGLKSGTECRTPRRKRGSQSEVAYVGDLLRVR